MPSDLAVPGRLGWLRSQGLGLLCGQATVLLLGAGTLVLAATRDGASAGVQADDLTVFFKEPSPVHWWLYALLPVTALYTLNTALCTWDSALARWRRGPSPASAWAPAVIHLAFLLALLAHGVGGFWNHDEAPLLVASSPVSLDGERSLRLAGLTRDVTPSGKLKQVHAQLEVTGPGGSKELVEVGYNQPLSTGLGAELLLLQEAGPHAGVALAWEGERCLLEPSGACRLGPHEVEVAGVQRGSREVALLRVTSPGQPRQGFPLAAGGSRALLGGGALRFEGVRVEDAVVLRHRRAPGHPIALASALVLLLGLGLMGRRWLKPPAEVAG